MLKAELKSAYILSVIIVFLMTLASAGGLFIDGLYQDNLLVTSGWYGNDLITLLIGVPLLIISLIYAKRGSQRAVLVWLGMLFYTLYNYAFYLFGSAFNSFFLVYVALFTFSMIALIFGVASLDAMEIKKSFRAGTPVKWVGGYMLFVVVLLGSFHVLLSVSYIFTGQVSDIIKNVGHPTNVISALDLSFVVSFGLLGGVWLWKRHPWGFIVALIWNIKGAVYMAALSSASIWVYKAGAAESVMQVALWGPIGVGSLIASVVLLRNLGNS